MKKVLAIVLALAMLFSFAACTKKEDPNPQQNGETKKDPITIRVAHDYAPESANYIAMDEFKENVEKTSNGEIFIDLYVNGELSGRNSQTTFKMLQSGDIDMAIVPPPNTNQWQLFYLPFFFHDTEQAMKVCEGEGGKKMLALLRETNNVVGLSYLSIAMRSMTNSKRPINEPKDMEGLTFRMLDVPTLVEFMKAFKASMVPMSMAELYAALQNKTVDGQENPLDTIRSQAFYEVQEYCSETNHIWSFSVFGANAAFWDKLTAEHQKILKDAAIEVGRRASSLSPEVTVKAREVLKEKGMKMNTITEENWKKFQDQSKQVWKTMEPTIGAEILATFMKDLGLTW